MTGYARFCPQCGSSRVGAFRYCQSCRYDFEPQSAAYGSTPSEPTTDRPRPAVIVRAEANMTATLAGVAWLVAAGILAYLAYVQWTLGAALTTAGFSDQGLRGVAAWNGVSALLTAYFGARCLRAPNKGFLTTSVGWAVLNVAWGTYQVVNGVGDSLFILTIVASGLAGVLSFAARDTAPALGRVS